MLGQMVAVGVFTDNGGRVLVTRRPPNVYLGGFWEFPGGKQELGETILETLERELSEELGVQITDAKPLLRIGAFNKGNAVHLCVYNILAWIGEPSGLEGQPLAWLPPAQLGALKFPPANAAIVREIMKR